MLFQSTGKASRRSLRRYQPDQVPRVCSQAKWPPLGVLSSASLSRSTRKVKPTGSETYRLSRNQRTGTLGARRQSGADLHSLNVERLAERCLFDSPSTDPSLPEGWQREDKKRDTHSHGAQDDPDPPDLDHPGGDGQCDPEKTDGSGLSSRWDSFSRPEVRDVTAGNRVRQKPAIKPV